MAIRTVEEYKASLRDGRRVYIMGEKVADVTTHPVLGPTCDLVGAAYELCAAKDPAIRDLYVAPHPVTGEPMSRFYLTPRTAEDLARRSTMIRRSIELLGDLPFGRDIGTDCLNAAFVVAGKMGKKEYQRTRAGFPRVPADRGSVHLRGRHLRQGGPLQGAVATEAPRLLPARGGQEQDGIVVKGAKIHITSGPAGQRDHGRSHPADAGERSRLRREPVPCRPTRRG